jgi:PAS domain S-box-containing protein
MQAAATVHDVRYQRLLDRVPAGAYLCDAEGLITYFNDYAVEVWGRAPALNDSIDRFCGSFRLYSSDGRPISHGECWMALALKNKRDYIGEEIVIERPDGSRRTVLAHASPIYSSDGQVDGAVNILVDITDRKEAERTNAFLGAIVETSDDAIVRKTLNGIIESWNIGAERLFGYTAGEAIGRSITIILTPDKLHEEDIILDRLRRGERIEHYETTRITKAGKRVEISVTISPIRDQAGQIIGASKIARDITARKQSEAALVALKNELQEANVRKNEFLAMLAHELRNPLAAVCNSLHLLALDDSLSPTLVEIREIMDQQAKQMIRLVDDLLDVTRISHGQIELRRDVVDLASIVASAVESARHHIDRVKHQLAIQLPAAPIMLDADPVRLAQVLGNLLSNAAKYTPPGGQIWLSAHLAIDGLEIAVRDNGVGIGADELPRVFDMFMQVESSRINAEGGLGLGLALAKKLIELHDGRIAVSSEGEGLGTTFVVWLPGSRLRNERCVPPPKLASTRRATSQILRILVVDDTDATAFVLSRLLEKLGHEVISVDNAIAAIEAVVKHKPNVIISDIAMPGMGGYELARRLKKMPEMHGVRLVALTGYGQDADRLEASEAGFDCHLVKPISVQTLQELLQDYSSAQVCP